MKITTRRRRHLDAHQAIRGGETLRGLWREYAGTELRPQPTGQAARPPVRP